MTHRNITGVDLFCGAGGLTHGLQKSGIYIAAGIDLDPACEYPYTHNNGALFICADVRALAGKDLAQLYPAGDVRLLAGCAPCQPFSPFRRGADTSGDDDWGLLGEFGRLVKELKPELVTMENVPDLAGKSIFQSFVSELERLQYKVHYRSVFCPPLGIPQQRRRLVLLASLLGDVAVPEGCRSEKNYRTVRQTIASLPRLKAGGADSKDPLHRARSASSLNLRRLQASKPGGTWRDWDKDLRAPCHRKKTGASYQSVYSRMTWDKPAPTITTLAHSFGSGRFGHPEQDRSISLREAALLQTFPRQYRFVRPRDEVFFFGVGRLIGNAVPPKLAFYIGKELLRTVTNLEEAPAP